MAIECQNYAHQCPRPDGLLPSMINTSVLPRTLDFDRSSGTTWRAIGSRISRGCRVWRAIVRDDRLDSMKENMSPSDLRSCKQDILGCPNHSKSPFFLVDRSVSRATKKPSAVYGSQSPGPELAARDQWIGFCTQIININMAKCNIILFI